MLLLGLDVMHLASISLIVEATFNLTATKSPLFCFRREFHLQSGYSLRDCVLPLLSPEELINPLGGAHAKGPVERRKQADHTALAGLSFVKFRVIFSLHC